MCVGFSAGGIWHSPRSRWGLCDRPHACLYSKPQAPRAVRVHDFGNLSSRRPVSRDDPLNEQLMSELWAGSQALWPPTVRLHPGNGPLPCLHFLSRGGLSASVQLWGQ